MELVGIGLILFSIMLGIFRIANNCENIYAQLKIRNSDAWSELVNKNLALELKLRDKNEKS